MSFLGRRASERFQGRGVAAAGAGAMVVAVAGGLLVHRLLREPRSVAARVTTLPLSARPTPSTWPLEPVVVRRPDDRAIYAKGQRLLAAGDARGALRPLAEVARRFPRDHAVVHDYGVALVRAGVQDLGIFQLDHASRLAPGIGAYRLDLIRALLAAGRAGPAGRELSALLERDPANVEAAALLASVTGGMSVTGSRRREDGQTAFTDDDLGRHRPPQPPAKVSLPESVIPSVAPHAPSASPSPPG